MLLIHCPYCGERPEIEFRHKGEAHIVRPENPAVSSDIEWTEFLYFRHNPKGPHAERWYHTHGCGRFFNAQRDTGTDRFLKTYRTDETP
ncbi:MAG: sarcosine oxidase subunit delta family protein [Acetobacteraceae bacterium]|nr:sarcosine oxidase subunit delta family protein [Acetobacteraceae bacterium]MSP29672.1 sarcosine oxidase subunit delta family protein [Acetobacteraceae bacterium]